FAPTFAYDLCLRRVKPSQMSALDLSSWRVAGCGAEPIRRTTLDEFAARFSGAGFRASSFVPSYGLAEHSLPVGFSMNGMRVDAVDSGRLVKDSRAVPVQNGGRPAHVVACGRPLPGHDVRIADDEGRQLPDRTVGNIIVRGPSVMTGYFEDEAA